MGECWLVMGGEIRPVWNKKKSKESVAGLKRLLKGRKQHLWRGRQQGISDDLSKRCYRESCVLRDALVKHIRAEAPECVSATLRKEIKPLSFLE